MKKKKVNNPEQSTYKKQLVAIIFIIFSSLFIYLNNDVFSCNRSKILNICSGWSGCSNIVKCSPLVSDEKLNTIHITSIVFAFIAFIIFVSLLFTIDNNYSKLTKGEVTKIKITNIIIYILLFYLGVRLIMLI